MLKTTLEHPFCSILSFSSGPPLNFQARLGVGVGLFHFMHLLGKHRNWDRLVGTDIALLYTASAGN